MKVKLTFPNAQDRHLLIDIQSFMEIVDEYDLSLRKSAEIVDAYHEHWFESIADGIHEFNPPVFYLQKGVAKFINGRHRTLLLQRNMTTIPMALANMDGFPTFMKKPDRLSEETLKRILVKSLEGHEVFDFPDLPVKYLGYDENLGK